ncbi:MAG: desulfoferrodoxin FeS4 iron-binding domain-containing protein, partial [Thermodesulfobacteriota bacterium]
MAQLFGVYKCEICGNIVTVLHEGSAEIHCCGKPMTLQIENSVDAAKEKHVPVVECIEEGVKVTVGSVAHPMEDDHYIEWIELTSGGKTQRQ